MTTVEFEQFSDAVKVQLATKFPSLPFCKSCAAEHIKDFSRIGKVILANKYPDEGPFQEHVQAKPAKFTNEELKLDAKDWTEDSLGAEAFYCHISGWDVSEVTDMSELFKRMNGFEEDISRWDVSNVTNMKCMFEGALNFNQDIESWNTDNVTNMGNMFSGAFAFNQDVGSWNMGNFTNMNSMFRNASAFNQPVGSWNTGNVTDMRHSKRTSGPGTRATSRI